MTRGGAAEPLDWSVDVLNLPSSDTGAVGIISISTERWREEPHVTWFPDRAWTGEPRLVVTLDAAPRITNRLLPQDQARRAELDVVAWVTANRDALLRFWHDGLSWTWAEVRVFIDGLRKLP